MARLRVFNLSRARATEMEYIRGEGHLVRGEGHLVKFKIIYKQFE